MNKWVNAMHPGERTASGMSKHLFQKVVLCTVISFTFNPIICHAIKLYY